MLTNTFPKTAFLYLFVLSLKGVLGAGTDEVKSVSVMDGDSVTLNTDVTEIQRDDHILWMFGPEDTRIAEIYNQNIKLFNIERFSEKLQMENQTGSLTIRNIRTEHTGLYKLQILSKETSYKRFSVTVYTPLPVPVISNNSSNCLSLSRSSESRCSLVCSVLNVSHVTLSWYAGISVLSNISVSDLSISLSLPLEVEYQDNNTYSCVINNPVTHQTTHLDITQLCQPCAEKQTVVLAASISAVLLLVLAGLMYFLYWKHKRMGRKRNGYESSAHRVETGEEVQYAETGFFQQNGQRKKANETEETIYSSIVT